MNKQREVQKVREIREKWDEMTADRNGYFTRHIDGNTRNNIPSNISYIHPYDAFTNPDWAVDWGCDLEDGEVQFVRDNIKNFASLYNYLQHCCRGVENHGHENSCEWYQGFISQNKRNKFDIRV